MSDMVEKFYEVVFRRPEMRTCSYNPVVPTEMIVDHKQDGKIEWRLLPWSKTVVPEFESLEKYTGHKLPEIFKLWHCRYYRMTDPFTAMYPIKLWFAYPKHPFADPSSIWRLGMGGDLIKARLIPIGHDGMPDKVCFDVTQTGTDGDYPIVTWFHECGENTRDGINATIFSSFEKLLECFIDYYSCSDEEWNDEMKHRKRAARFFDIDPNGAGGTDKWYWELYMKDWDEEEDLSSASEFQ